MPRPDDDRYIDPTPAQRRGAEVLTAEQVASWRSAGFALVDGLFPDDLLAAQRRFGQSRLPDPGSDAARATSDFGSDLTFPQPEPAFNEITLHPRFLGAVAQLLGTAVRELRLTQSELWPKYGRPERTAGALDNQDQRIHVDYPNHTLVHPPPWHRPEAVEVILYLDDLEDVGGATAVVPRRGDEDPAYRWPLVDSPGIADLDFVNDREAAEASMREQRPSAAALRELLYERERYTRFRRGSVLFYRHDTWHRGTPMKPGALRIAQNFTFRLAGREWISTMHVGWAWRMFHPEKYIERLIARASLDQRAVLGFPQPGSDYWCEETLAAVEARYGVFGMDMAPYRAALQRKEIALHG